MAVIEYLPSMSCQAAERGFWIATCFIMAMVILHFIVYVHIRTREENENEILRESLRIKKEVIGEDGQN